MNKRWIAVAVMCLSLAGCVPTEQQIIGLSDDVGLLMARIDERQDEVVSGLDTVQDNVRAVNDAVAAAKTLPAKVEAGIEASRPFNPYADEMALAALGLTTLGGILFGRKKSKDAAVSEDRRLSTNASHGIEIRALSVKRDTENRLRGLAEKEGDALREAGKLLTDSLDQIHVAFPDEWEVISPTITKMIRPISTAEATIRGLRDIS